MLSRIESRFEIDIRSSSFSSSSISDVSSPTQQSGQPPQVQPFAAHLQLQPQSPALSSLSSIDPDGDITSGVPNSTSSDGTEGIGFAIAKYAFSRRTVQLGFINGCNYIYQFSVVFPSFHFKLL